MPSLLATSPDLTRTHSEVSARTMKQVKVVKGISKMIKQENLEAKKPKGMGINADKFKLVVGQRATRDLEKWDFITDEDVDG